MASKDAGGFAFEKKKPKARGHRQKGQGTVVKSKGEVQHGGIKMKEWQRSPKQLLQEFTQSQKRQKPYYSRCFAPEGKFRYRVTLADPKKQEKNIIVSSEQHFNTRLEAEHASALLCLHTVDGQRQYERKLPEPYATSWLELSGRKAADSSVDKKGRKKKEMLVCDVCGKEFKAQHGLDTHKSRQHPVDKNAAADEVEENQVDESSEGFDLYDTASTITASTSNSVSASALPGSLTLSKSSKYATKQDKRLAYEAKSKKHSEIERSKAAIVRSNPNATLFMSETNRKFIESIIKQCKSNDAAGRSNTTTISKEINLKVTKQVEKLGFRSEDIETAFVNIDLSASEEDTDVVQQMLLDYLLVHVPEHLLPTKFNPQTKSLKIVSSNKTVAFDSEKPVSPELRLLQECIQIQTDNPNKCDIFELFQLYSHFVEYLELPPWVTAATDGINSNSTPLDDVRSFVEDEEMVLESMFGDEYRRQEITSHHYHTSLQVIKYQFTLNSTGKVKGDTRLHLYLTVPSENESQETTPSKQLCYPAKPALVVLTNPLLSSDVLLTLTSKLSTKSYELVDRSMIYELYTTANDLMAEYTSHTQQLLEVPIFSKSKMERVELDLSVSTAATRKTSKKSNRRRNTPSAAQRSKWSEALSRRMQQLQSSDRYQAMMKARAKLPAYKQQKEILHAINNNQVVLISGETGCGKTTQVPQLILDDMILGNAGGEAQIICTQPRRLAAIGVAMRVADERGDPEDQIGGLVGYQVRSKSEMTQNTRLAYVTTGILLRRLQNDRMLDSVSHVVMDEVHERDVNSDFLLAILKSVLKKRPSLKLILMSATMDADMFAKYFQTRNKPCPIIAIPGFIHPVEDFFLRDILFKTNYRPDTHQMRRFLSKSKKKADKAAAKTEDCGDEISDVLQMLDGGQVDYELIASLVRYINSKYADDGGDGAILIFMSGTAEISRTVSTIKQMAGSDHGVPELLVLPLHGSLSGSDQVKVFNKPGRNRRKVVVSTNVAETSITIDDIVYVIDSGRMKEMRYDSYNKMSMLVDTWISQASATQRRGRAGRVRPGKCFKLFSKKRMNAMMQSQIPEILRVPLEQLVLQVMLLELDDPNKFMKSVIQPPASESVQVAVELLIDINAMSKVNGKLQLTSLGKHISCLPMEVRIAKMLIYGCLLDCMEEIIIIAAGLSVRSIFMSPADKRDEANEAKKKLALQSYKSDHITLLIAFLKWDELSSRDQKHFAEDNFLSYSSLREIQLLRRDFQSALADIGFASRRGRPSVTADDLSQEKCQMIKAALTAGMYPNVIMVRKPKQLYQETIGGNFEQLPEAKQLKYMIQPSSGAGEAHVTTKVKDMERVFIHPASVNFHERDYVNSPWLVYREKVHTSKVYVRDCTVILPYSLLLFGGDITVQHAEGTVSIDEWIVFNASAKIGVLAKEIKVLLDNLLAEKFTNPNIQLENHIVIQAIYKLIAGLGFK